MEKSKVKQAAFSAVLIVVSLCVSLALIEMVLRIKNSAMDVYDIEMWRYSGALKKRSENPVLGHEHVKSASAILQNVDIRINEKGLRGGPVGPIVPGQRRILFLGSSVTLGWGVKEEETLTSRLQAMFSKDGQDVVVLNAGIGNYNAVRYVERFLTRLTDLKPTDIVVQYFVNDAERLDAGGGNIVLRNSQLAVTLWIVANRIFSPSGEGSLESHYRKVYDPASGGLKDMMGALQKLGDYARSDGIRLFLAMTPDVHNLQDYPLGFAHDVMRKVASESGYQYIDLLPALRNIKPNDLWALPGDPHPNSRGHEIMARALYPNLTRTP